MYIYPLAISHREVDRFSVLQQVNHIKSWCLHMFTIHFLWSIAISITRTQSPPRSLASQQRAPGHAASALATYTHVHIYPATIVPEDRINDLQVTCNGRHNWYILVLGYSNTQFPKVQKKQGNIMILMVYLIFPQVFSFYLMFPQVFSLFSHLCSRVFTRSLPGRATAADDAGVGHLILLQTNLLGRWVTVIESTSYGLSRPNREKYGLCI